jgi:hypothetical protein
VLCFWICGLRILKDLALWASPQHRSAGTSGVHEPRLWTPIPDVFRMNIKVKGRRKSVLQVDENKDRLFRARGSLCVTEGAIGDVAGGRLSVTVPKMRAYVNAMTGPSVEADFTYLGSTGNEARLGSGELRRQFGLKLRAQDACNLVYAMWRIEPESKLVVSVKSNPGQHTSAECGNRGYRNVKAARSKPVPELHPGMAHSLRAEMNVAEMRVFADGAWCGKARWERKLWRSMDLWGCVPTMRGWKLICAPGSSPGWWTGAGLPHGPRRIGISATDCPGGKFLKSVYTIVTAFPAEHRFRKRDKIGQSGFR